VNAKDFIQQTREAAVRLRRVRAKREEARKQYAPSPSPKPLPKKPPSPKSKRIIPKRHVKPFSAPSPSSSPRPPTPPPLPLPPTKSQPTATLLPPPPALHEDLSLTSWSPSTELCGTVRVTPGSPIVETTCDLRLEIQNGDGIRIGTFESTVTTPRDKRTLTLNDPYQGLGGEHLKPYKIDLIAQFVEGYKPIPGCISVLHGSNVMSTSMDIRSAIGVGEVLRVRNQDYTIMAPRTESMVMLSQPFKLRSSGTGCEHAYKRIRPWDGGMTPLTCCASMKESDSTVVLTDHDLSNEVKEGDTIRIRTETFRVSGPVTPTSFTILPPSRLSSADELRIFLQINCTKLPGTVGVTKGDSVVTTSADFRSVLGVGDTVQLGSEEYEVVVTPDPMSVVLSRDYQEDTTNRLRISRCLFPSEENNDDGRINANGKYVVPAAVPLSTFLRLTKGSSDGVAVLRPDIDDIGPGDRIRLCGIAYVIDEIFDGQKSGAIIRLNRPYLGTSGKCRMWRVPLSKKQDILRALSVRKLKCLSLYCLAKIEEEERSISFDLDAEMTRLPSSSWTTLSGKDTMSELHDMVEKEKKQKELSAEVSPSPSGQHVTNERSDSLLKDPGAGPGMPVVPPELEERGNGRKSGRMSDLLKNEHDGSEEDAMKGEGATLVFPAEVGTNKGIEKTIVQSVNIPKKRKSVNAHDAELVESLTVEEEGSVGGMENKDMLTDWVAVVKKQQSGKGPFQGLIPTSM